MRALAVILLVTLAIVLFEETSAAKKPECKFGVSKKEGCNNCFCTAGGVWACTKRVCRLNKRDAFRCNPGEVFKMSCNTCRCNADGTNASCTLKFCPHH